MAAKLLCRVVLPVVERMELHRRVRKRPGDKHLTAVIGAPGPLRGILSPNPQPNSLWQDTICPCSLQRPPPGRS